MSYDRGDTPPFFDQEQSRRIAARARRFARAGAPAAVPGPAGSDLPPEIAAD
jgi:hypothetical protein